MQVLDERCVNEMEALNITLPVLADLKHYLRMCPSMICEKE